MNSADRQTDGQWLPRTGGELVPLPRTKEPRAGHRFLKFPFEFCRLPHDQVGDAYADQFPARQPRDSQTSRVDFLDLQRLELEDDKRVVRLVEQRQGHVLIGNEAISLPPRCVQEYDLLRDPGTRRERHSSTKNRGPQIKPKCATSTVWDGARFSIREVSGTALAAGFA